MRLTANIHRLIFFALILSVSPGCGGGGGGGAAGGGGGSTPDVTAPSISFSSPSGTLSYEADPSSLPSQLAVSYSDAGGVRSSTFSATLSFRGASFDLAGLFSAGSSSATTGSNASPLYWTIISKYNIGDGSLLGHIGVYGVSSGSSGALNMLDADPRDNILAAAASSRNKLLIINLTSGATQREISLAAAPAVIRTCPEYGKVYVAYQNSATLDSYTLSTGALEAQITLPAAPKSMALNRVASKAYVIYENSQTLTTINCNGNSVSSASIGQIPQRISTDGLAAGKIYYAGGIGANKGVYSYLSGVENKLFSVAELPEDLWYDNVSDKLFLVNYGTDAVDAYNAATGALAAQTAVGDQPTSAAGAPASAKAFTLNKGSDTISVLNSSTGALSSTISLIADPVGMSADTSNGVLYVLQNIWAISTTSTATLTASVGDNSGNTANTSLTLTIRPVATGGPGTPGTP